MTTRAYCHSVGGPGLVVEARKRAGLSQAQLAQRLGVGRSTVSGWETGRVQPTFDSVTRVMEACGLDLEVHLVPRDEAARRILA